MTKYYRVYLNEYLIGNVIHMDKQHPVICKRNSITEKFYSEFVFTEIITGKVIYPSTMELRKSLTYEMRTGYHEIKPHCEEISSVEVKEWLNNMNEESVKEYINDINRVEKMAIDAYEEDQQNKKEERYQSKIASKTIKRALRKIKQR